MCEERKRKYAIIEHPDEINSELEKRPVKIKKMILYKTQEKLIPEMII